MRRYCFYLFIILFLSPLSFYGRNAEEAFLSMPSEMFKEISIENRMDLLDIYKAQNPSSVQNKFGDDIIIEDLTEDYLSINSGNSTLQIIVLQMINESQLYCLIHTVCGPICDSQIEFYSLSWKKLNKEAFISIASKNQFFSNSDEFPELSISFMQFQYDKTNNVLIQTNNSYQYLSIEDQKKVKSYIKQEAIEYKWNGIKFDE